MANTITQQALYDTLIADTRVRTAQKSQVVDLAAGLVALASVEAARGWLGGLNVESQGDYVLSVPRAHGLWQVNDRVHKVDLGMIPHVEYQIGLALGVWAEVAGIVRTGYKSIEARRNKGDAMDFSPARDLPHFFNVGWQYGIGGLQNWINSSDDMTIAGFQAHRVEIGKPVTAEYSKRAASFRSAYDFFVANPPTFWSDADSATLAKEGIANNLPDIPKFPHIPTPGELAGNLAGALWQAGKAFLVIATGLVVLGLLVAVYYIRSANRVAASVRNVKAGPLGVEVSK